MPNSNTLCWCDWPPLLFAELLNISTSPTGLLWHFTKANMNATAFWRYHSAMLELACFNEIFFLRPKKVRQPMHTCVRTLVLSSGAPRDIQNPDSPLYAQSVSAWYVTHTILISGRYGRSLSDSYSYYHHIRRSAEIWLLVSSNLHCFFSAV